MLNNTYLSVNVSRLFETYCMYIAVLYLLCEGISQLATKDGKHLADPEVLRRLTSSVSCALDEAAAALTRMRTDNPRSSHSEKTLVLLILVFMFIHICI